MLADLPDLFAAADPAVILGLVAALACITGLGLPGPASLALVAAGAAASAGLVDPGALLVAGTAGAVAGDLGGHRLGRAGGGAIRAGAVRRPRLAAALGRAEVIVSRNGLAAVFLTRWLIPPLGPATSLAAGAAGLMLLPFALASVAGRVIWVALYAGLGWLFSDAVGEAADRAATASAMLAALAVVLAAVAVWWRGQLRS